MNMRPSESAPLYWGEQNSSFQNVKIHFSSSCNEAPLIARIGYLILQDLKDVPHPLECRDVFRRRLQKLMKMFFVCVCFCVYAHIHASIDHECLCLKRHHILWLYSLIAYVLFLEVHLISKTNTNQSLDHFIFWYLQLHDISET